MTEDNGLVLTIAKHSDLINFIKTINGYLRTPKLDKFNDLILFLNEKYGYNLDLHKEDNSPLNSKF